MANLGALSSEMTTLATPLHSSVKPSVMWLYRDSSSNSFQTSDRTTIFFVRSETGHQKSVVALLLLLHVHEVPGFDVLEGIGNDRLAVPPCLPLRGAVVKDDRPSVLRWIEVVEQVSVGGHEGNEHPVIDHPTT